MKFWNHFPPLPENHIPLRMVLCDFLSISFPICKSEQQCTFIGCHKNEIKLYSPGKTTCPCLAPSTHLCYADFGNSYICPALFLFRGSDWLKKSSFRGTVGIGQICNGYSAYVRQGENKERKRNTELWGHFISSHCNHLESKCLTYIGVQCIKDWLDCLTENFRTCG